MSNKRKRELMEKLDRCYKVVQQSRNGINAIGIAKKLDIHRTTAHSYLNTLELMGKVYSQKGLWYPEEPSTKENSLPEESESDKAKAFQIMRTIEALISPLTEEEWAYFNQNNGKSKLDKARALAIIKGTKALVG